MVPSSSARSWSAMVRGNFSLCRLSFSLVKSTHSLALPLLYWTATIWVHQSAGDFTGWIMSSFSRRYSSSWTFYFIGNDNLLSIAMKNGWSPASKRILNTFSSLPGPVNSSENSFLYWCPSILTVLTTFSWFRGLTASPSSNDSWRFPTTYRSYELDLFVASVASTLPITVISWSVQSLFAGWVRGNFFKYRSRITFTSAPISHLKFKDL